MEVWNWKQRICTADLVAVIQSGISILVECPKGSPPHRNPRCVAELHSMHFQSSQVCYLNQRSPSSLLLFLRLCSLPLLYEFPGRSGQEKYFFPAKVEWHEGNQSIRTALFQAHDHHLGCCDPGFFSIIDSTPGTQVNKKLRPPREIELVAFWDIWGILSHSQKTWSHWTQLSKISNKPFGPSVPAPASKVGRSASQFMSSPHFSRAASINLWIFTKKIFPPVEASNSTLLLWDRRVKESSLYQWQGGKLHNS